MRVVFQRRVLGSSATVLLGIAAAIALHASPCSSASSAAGSFASHSAGGAGLPSARQAHGALAGDPLAGLHSSGREGRTHGRPAQDEDEDSLHDNIKLQLNQVDELVSHMSQFQERTAALAGELEKRAAENDRLVEALESVMPREDLERENIRRSEMLTSMGLHSAMEVDTAAPFSSAAAMNTEIGSSPTCFMDTVETPARLRGGGAQDGDAADGVWVGGGASRRRDLLSSRLTLRGGGNVLSIGTKYSAKEYALNKQLCGAVKKGDEKEIKRLVKEGADPCYSDCDMLGFSTLHMAVNSKQMKSLEVLRDIGGNVHIKDGLGWTLMHQAAHNADTNAVDKLNKYGVSVLIKNNAGRLPAAVTKAAGQGSMYRECYKKLLKMQEEAAGHKKEEVQKVVEAAAANEDDEEEEEDEEEEPEPPKQEKSDSKDKGKKGDKKH